MSPAFVDVVERGSPLDPGRCSRVDPGGCSLTSPEDFHLLVTSRLTFAAGFLLTDSAFVHRASATALRERSTRLFAGGVEPRASLAGNWGRRPCQEVSPVAAFRSAEPGSGVKGAPTVIRVAPLTQVAPALLQASGDGRRPTRVCL